MTETFINRIATAVPNHDVHHAFVGFADGMLEDDRVRQLFRRMSRLSAIDHRFSFIQPEMNAHGVWEDSSGFYVRGSFPDTAQRMRTFEQVAPGLAHSALDRLQLTAEEKRLITHVLVTSCTGLYAPGLDFEVVDYLGLHPSVERTMIGFMGCYAAVNALKLARHIVRSEPHAKVLVLNLELCTLHLQETQELEQVLSFLLFGDGCAASLISADNYGLALDRFRAVLIPETRELITWKIRELGFDMLLSGRVPGCIGRSLEGRSEEIVNGGRTDEVDLWAIHPGGRSVLDAVEAGLHLPGHALQCSREILSAFGNMSSATIMFVLEKLMHVARPGQRGCAMSFGPGLTAETLLFHAA